MLLSRLSFNVEERTYCRLLDEEIIIPHCLDLEDLDSFVSVAKFAHNGSNALDDGGLRGV